MPEFAHLHLHTEFSLLDGMGRIDDYVRLAHEKNIKHLALTDHGVMYGAMDWHGKLTDAGLHPIIGMEAYFADGPAAPPPPDAGEEERKARRNSFHLLLLAQNTTGYRNLLRLASKASLEGFYYRPRIDREMLAQYSSGLSATSACLGGPVARNFLREKPDAARDHAGSLAEIFGRDRFFIELQDHGLKEQRAVNPELISLAKSFDLPMVVTNDVHYCNQLDAPAQEILVCVQTNKTLDDPTRLKQETDELYLKSPEEMWDRFSEIPEALTNTMRIAEMCELDLTTGEYQLPDFAAPDGLSNHQYLEKLCRDGAIAYYGHDTGEVGERLAFELGVIGQMKLTNYFLVVWDFVRFAKENGILVGPGRGSALGSMVSFTLGITALDPLRYGLLFERFLNPSRISMPDIDIDFADDRRQEVINYVVQKYGEDRVAQIITFGTMAAKGSVRDVGKAMGMPLSEIDRVAKLIPNTPKIKLDEAIDGVPELKTIYESDPGLRKLIDTAKTVEGVARHSSTHAAGVVISRGPLIDTVPLQRAGGKSEGEITTHFPMGQLESLGLLKIDFLGLTTLTIIGKAVELAKAKDPNLTVENIPLEDDYAYSLLRRGDTHGIFQLEGGMTTRMTVDVAPERFEDIIALMALIRPGPMENAPEYIGRKHGRLEISYMHPDLEPILKETYGIAVYQEQVMQVANAIAGFSLAEGDGLRKAMGKKNKEFFESYRTPFISGAAEHGLSDKLANDIFDLLGKFGNYGFNKSHSAGYAVISAQTAYMKAHYPVEFMAAFLSSSSDNSERIVLDIAECRRLGIPVHGPNVSRSQVDFTVEVDDDGVEGIRFGLGAIRNVGKGAAAAIVESREALDDQRYSSLDEFCETVDWTRISRRVAESLGRAGALDEFGPRRSVLNLLEPAIAAANERRKAAARGQLGFDMQMPVVPTPTQITPTAANGFVDDLPMKQRLAWERELLGVYISEHPVEEALRKAGTAGRVQIAELPDRGHDSRVRLIARVNGMRRLVTRTGKSMGVADLEDLTGTIELVLFPEKYQEYGEVVEVDEILDVFARFEQKDDRRQLICEQVLTEIENLQKSDRFLHVRFPDLQKETDLVDLMRGVDRVLKGHEGDDRVVFHLRIAGEERLLRSRSLQVDADDYLIRALEQILGAGSVTIDPPALALAMSA
ncbi:MAG: DNA polymerase III subunit alpha [Thermomicrobiales bacterium]|nr:DNA polymerase III subunit alpha [Thermomicrobiales bacterium]